MSNEHDDIEMLLPWYESGRLDDADLKRVEAFLARDPDLSSQLALIREERTAAVEANEAMGAPGPGALDRLMASIEVGEGQFMAGPAGGLRGWASRLFGVPVSTGLVWLAAAAAILIVVQAAALGILFTSGWQPDAQYQIATGGDAASAEGTFAYVRFTDTAKALDIANFLSELDAVIVDGPKPDGAFKIRLSDTRLSEANRDVLLKKLLANQILIISAESVD